MLYSTMIIIVKRKNTIVENFSNRFALVKQCRGWEGSSLAKDRGAHETGIYHGWRVLKPMLVNGLTG